MKLMGRDFLCFYNINYLCLSLRPQKLYTPCVLNCFFLRAKAKISMFFIV